jgi:quinol monooxygenase YgiN
MFIAVYRFKIKPATKEAFIQAWKTHIDVDL